MKLFFTILSTGLLLVYLIGAAGKSNLEQKADAAPLHVKLNVTVLDSSNRPVTDLSSEDFQVFEGDVHQTITSVKRQDGPLSFGLVVDSSGSLRSQFSTVIRSAEMIIANMKQEDDAFLIRFVSHNNITVMQDWTSNRAKLKSKLSEFYPEGGQSAVIDAVYVAAEHIEERRKLETSPHRHALILITDGDDRQSYYNLEQLLKLLGDSDLQIFVIGLSGDIEGKKAQEQSFALMYTLANETGGRLFLVDGKMEALHSIVSPNAVDSALLSNRTVELQQIAAEFSIERDAQYVIGYDSTNSARDGSFRTVRVTIKQKEGRDRRVALTRPGYTVPGK